MSPTGTDAVAYGSIKDRARIYLAVFREISDRHGEDEAVSVLQAASRAHGREVGGEMAKFAPNDFQSMLTEYFEAPDCGATFSPLVREISATCLDVQMMTCPLKDGWLAMGCSEAEVLTLLRCATAFDHAVYTTAGFTYEFEAWSPGKAGCCRTRLMHGPE